MRRKRVVTRWGYFSDVMEQYGKLHKKMFLWPFKTKRAKKNYLAAGFTRRGFDDDVPDTNTRQALKREIDTLLFE